MTKAASDERLVRLAMARATAAGKEEIDVHYATLVNVTALNGLITTEQQTAFDNMDAMYSHPRKIKVTLAALVAALP